MTYTNLYRHLILIILLLSLSGLEKLFTLLPLVSSTAVYLMSLLVMLFLISRKSWYKSIFHFPVFMVFMCFFILQIMPFLLATIINAYSFNDFVRWSTRYLYYCSLFFVAYIYFSYYRLFSRKIIISLALLAYTFVLVRLLPDLAIEIGRQYSATNSYVIWGNVQVDRLFGLHIHPNTAAITVFLLTALILNVYRLSIITCITAVVLIASTGSRTALSALMILLLLGYFLPYVIERLQRYRINSQLIFLLMMVALFFIVVFVVTFIGIFPSVLNFFGLYELSDRFSVLIAGDIAGDQSFQERINAQRIYLQIAMERPIFGSGPLHFKNLVADGIINKTSHNVFLERFASFGVFGVMSMLIILVFFLYRVLTSCATQASKYIGSTTVLLLFFYCFFIGTLDTTPAFYILLGGMSAKFFPKKTATPH